MREETIVALQRKLIDTLKETAALKTPQVEQAFLSVPRHLFLPNEPLERAYSDIAIAVKRGEEGQWTSSSSQPAIMAIMLEQLDLHPGQRVLEIGAGTGFNAALMAFLVGREGQVTTVDIQPDLIEAAREHLEEAGYGWVQAVAGDGGYGYPANAPYDRVILTVSSAVIAPAWREQLLPGGRLVLPFNIGGPQISVAFERRGEELVSVSLSDCGFMPLQGAFSSAQPEHTQIGPDSRLTVGSAQPLRCEASRLAEWLAAYQANPAAIPSIPSGVRVSVREIWGLFTWLSIRQEPWGQLSAEGDLAAKNTIPPLLHFGRGEEWHNMLTALLAMQDSAAVLSRPPGQAAPFTDFETTAPAPADPDFELHVRPFGQGEAAALRLLQTLREWDQAGKPNSARLRLRALPSEMEYRAKEGERMLERPWTKVVVRYG